MVADKGANKWWTRPPMPKTILWETLDHNGILFAPAYEPHGVKMLYDGQPVELAPAAEEVATFFASMLDTDYMKNPIFLRNFFDDWKKVLGPGHAIKELAKCDFTPIRVWVEKERERKKEERKTAEFKKHAKEEKARLDSLYGFALVNGYKEVVGNYKVEIPGLFRGRAAHPKTGRIKKRIQPEDVTLNIGVGMPIPPPPPGHHWDGIVHDNTVTWLAMYKDPITNSHKYIYPAASSSFKGESDRNKYEKARRLCFHIDKIRQQYNADMRSKSVAERQRATALYLIDKLALRVGNEKNTDEEADTVGCCSLRVQHLSFNPEHKVVFDFLGKDSIRYFNEVQIDPIAYANLKEFCTERGKKEDSDVFDRLTTTALNEFLKGLMPGLSAKVFR